MTNEAAAEEPAAQPAAEAAPEGQHPPPPALVMIGTEDVQACAADGTCWGAAQC